MFASTKTSSPSGYQISRSLRFRASASPSLTRTPSVSGNRTTWTFSFWYKGGMPTGTQKAILCVGTSTGNDVTLLAVENQTLRFYHYTTGTVWQLIPTQVFRDPSAWYHIVAVLDTGNATSTDRARLYVNGTRITSFSSATYPTLNYATSFVNANVLHRIGVQDFYHDFYLTEVNMIDGQALDASSFGAFDAITGVWSSKKYSGTYGTNGFYLNFADNSGATATTIGKDSSGNGNNWTPTNISVTAGVTYDSMLDVPTPYDDGGNGRGNYATLNPLGTAATPIDGNLNANTTGSIYAVPATIAFPSTGKFYAEFTVLSASSPYPQCGILDFSANFRLNAGLQSVGQGVIYSQNGALQVDGATGSTYATFTTNDVIGVAYDTATRQVWVSKNNTWQNSGNPAAGTGAVATATAPTQGYVFACGGFSLGQIAANFGQRPFTYTPPSGFKALNTQNLPDQTIKNGSNWFDVKLDTGANIKTTAEATFSGDDLVWIKDRANANNHQLIDTIRGSTAVLQSNSTSAETTYTAPTGNSVAWVWKEGATPGFDIVTYTGNGANRTIAHSLGVAPSMMIVKQRTAASATNWAVWHKGIANTEYLLLNSTAAKATGATYWNSTSPTSSVFSLGTAADVNTNTGTYVNYLFSEVEGFSRFGSYTGNGSTDGPFVYCGFRPRFVMIKRTDATDHWIMYDTSRDTYNVTQSQLNANQSAAEVTGFNLTDFLSNGFKLRDALTRSNASGGTYIFAAFAENPFKYSLAR